ncbi:RHS repeat family protein, partial [Neisseria sp. MVDL18-041461]|nr:RHS repeat family protein [Neisseria sp. MVDL19-042950]MDO1517282.1 RHS repeat family protein [Neisseria sp. MVDL18-041461]MDO1564641.1 RHS repeat family protein [Neisseria sp. MVDL20-010259]
MALNKIARKSSSFRVIFTVPDFCWPPPPAPPTVPPIPFPLFADLGGAIDDQGRLFPLPEVDEDDEEPVLFESEQIWFSKNSDGHYVIASLDGSVSLRFAPLAVSEDDPNGDSCSLLPLVAVEDANGNHQRFIYHPLTGLPQYIIDGNGRVFYLHFGNVADAAAPKLRLLSVSLLDALPAVG